MPPSAALTPYLQALASALATILSGTRAYDAYEARKIWKARALGAVTLLLAYFAFRRFRS
jgi:hypothetical protein